jgi:uncharacterized membrane protein HdeD (DUF308 family)
VQEKEHAVTKLRRLKIWSFVSGSICILLGIFLLFSSGMFSLGWWVGGFFTLYGVLCLISGITTGKGTTWVKELPTISFPLGGSRERDDVEEQ